jgi:AraC-like DNA-binding protein
MHRTEKGEGFPHQRIMVLPRPVIEQAGRHPLLCGLLPTDVGRFPKAQGHCRTRPEGAPQTIFILCTAGSGWCDTAQARHSVHPGDLLVLPPGQPHTYGADDHHPWTIHWFHAVGSLIPAFTRELGVSPTRPVGRVNPDLTTLALIDELLDALEQGYTTPQLCHAAHTLGHVLARLLWLRHQNGEPLADRREQLGHSIEHMRRHLDRRLRVSDLASLIGLSPSHFTALFKQHTGYAPMDYFIRLRLHRACQLLDTTRLPIKSIAHQVGYDDPLYFSRAFHAVHHLSPTRYRAIRKG